MKTRSHLTFFQIILSSLLMLLSGASYGDSTGGGHLNAYKFLVDAFGVDVAFSPILSSLLALVVCLIMGVFFRASVERSLKQKDIAPQGRFGLRTVIEMILSFVDELAAEQTGGFYKIFFPLLTSIFLFILVSNLSGLIPGLPPFTENFSANLVIGLTVFVCYNIAGIYEHRASYLKQFMGPFLLLAPLFLILETIGHLARPLSLSFRLTANIYGDHLLLGIFSGLVPFLVPSFLLFFGLLVAVIQSFVFTMLTGVYVSMAIAHDH